MKKKPETARTSTEPLRAREERVIALLLAGRTPKEICSEVPISKTTLWRLRKTEAFQQRFAEVRQEAFASAVNTEPTANKKQRSRARGAREERVIALLLAGRSVKEICKLTPIDRTSLWRLRKTEAFQQRFAEVRQEAFASAVNCLHDSAIVFARTLREVCEDSKARAGERATAARSGLDSFVKVLEVFDHEQRLRQIEQSLAGGGGK